MNYNTQQVFWGVFSSNHADQHLPYIEIVENLLQMAETTAKDQFGLPGAYFPHSAYPVPSRVVPYPAPPWAYEICETPWTVQSLWWHYLYTLDEVLLRRIYRPLKEAAQFIAAYANAARMASFTSILQSRRRIGASLSTSVEPGLHHGHSPGAVLLSAVVEASGKLGVDADLRAGWADLHANLASYPKAETQRVKFGSTCGTHRRAGSTMSR